MGSFEIPGLLALGGLIAAFVLLRESNAWLYHGGFLAVAALSATLIASTLSGPSVVTRFLSSTPLRLIGVISYGLYLWHWPIYVVVNPQRTGLEGTPLLVLRLLLTFGLAFVSYVAVEQPIRRGAPRLLATPVRRIAIAGAMSLVLGSTVLATQQAVGPVTASTASPGAHAATPPATVSAYLVGDSVPLNLREEYTADLVPGLGVSGSTQLGCGLIPVPRSVDGEVHPLTQDCEGWVHAWRSEIVQARPDVAVLFPGIGEQFDHVVGGRTLTFGTRPFARHLDDALSHDIRVMRQAADTVAIVTVPCHGVIDTGLNKEARITNDRARLSWLNDHIRRIAARQSPAIPVVDLDRHLCAHGYTNTRNGVTLRKDGLHFTHEGAAVVWGWLGPQLLRLDSS
jgi:hypothetical protein